MISAYQKVTRNRIHASLRAAMKAGDIAFLQYRVGRVRRYKEVTITRVSAKSVFICDFERTDVERRFSIKDGVEWGKGLPMNYRDRLFACTEDLSAYIEQRTREQDEERWREQTIQEIKTWQMQATSSNALRAVRKLLENDKGRTHELLERMPK